MIEKYINNTVATDNWKRVSVNSRYSFGKTVTSKGIA